MADEKPKPKAKAADAHIRITPLGLSPGAHLHTSAGRIGMGGSRECPAAEAERYIKARRAAPAEDEPAFVDQPRIDAGLDA